MKMDLFDTIYDEYNHCSMGNLYNYDAFTGNLTIVGLKCYAMAW